MTFMMKNMECFPVRGLQHLSGHRQTFHLGKKPDSRFLNPQIKYSMISVYAWQCSIVPAIQQGKPR